MAVSDELAKEPPGTRTPFPHTLVAQPENQPPIPKLEGNAEEQGVPAWDGRPTSLRYRLWEWRLSTYTSSSGSRPRFPPPLPLPPEDGGDIAASPLPPPIRSVGDQQ
jgi:hypothetical protein